MLRGNKETEGKELDEMNAEELGMLFPIHLEESRDDWESVYRAERMRIVEALHCSNIAAIEHIGSTAVPGIVSKPTVDVLLVLEREAELDYVVSGMKSLGYSYIPKPENPEPHMMFVKGYTKHGFEGQTFHVHVRYPGEHDEPIFRDYLIEHPGIAAEYEMLKVELAAMYRHDRESYTEGKSRFVSRILKEAKHDFALSD